MSLEDVIFIVNPNSGKKKSQQVIDAIRIKAPESSIFISESKEHLEGFFASEIQKFGIVVICGGDGTVNSVLKYREHPNIIFGILPLGSGDGFAREIGFTSDLELLLEKINKRSFQETDIFSVNGKLSCNIIGIGFDSYVTNIFEQNKKRGLFSYVIAGVKAYINYKPIRAKITTDDSFIESNYLMINAANSRQFGNNAIIAPKAKLDSGKMEVVLVKRLPLYYIPLFLVKLFKGTLKDSKYIQYISTKTLKVESDFPFYHIDGETLSGSGTLNVEVSGKIKFLK